MKTVDKEKLCIDFLRANKEDIPLFTIKSIGEKFGLSIYKVRKMIKHVRAGA
jgi:hypothetical protein